MERLEEVLRTGKPWGSIAVMLRGGVDSAAKIVRQASMLQARYSFRGGPALGISMFAAEGDLETWAVLGGKLRTYPKCRRVPADRLCDRFLMLPTFQIPHWTILLDGALGDLADGTSVLELLDILGPVLDNPKYEPTRARWR